MVNVSANTKTTMSRAEEQARKAYPDNPYYGGRSAQRLFAEGYEQAEKDLTDKAKFSSGWDGFYYGQGYKQAKKDLMEKFKMWVAYNGYTAKDAEAVYNDFKQFMTEN